jgi:hypothetical protein
MKVSGNPDVFEEAEDKHGTRKRGGKVTRATGGKIVGLMTGGAARPRMDRPGRKRGGAGRCEASSVTGRAAGGKPCAVPDRDAVASTLAGQAIAGTGRACTWRERDVVRPATPALAGAGRLAGRAELAVRSR